MKPLIKLTLCAIAIVIMTTLAIDIIRYPECYITTWKYQLQQEIKKGDVDALDYYNSTYIANNRCLYEE